MANFGPFSGPRMATSCQKKETMFCDFSECFSCFLLYLLTTFRPCFQSVLFFHIYLFPHIFTTNIAQPHTHTHTHTFTPATDRDLESGLSKSHTRKNPGKCLKKAKSGETLPILTGKTTDQSNHLVAGSLPSFPRFQGKSEWLEDSGTRYSRPFLKLELGKIPCLLPVNPSSKWQLHVDHLW